jgi:hypothetical protein
MRIRSFVIRAAVLLAGAAGLTAGPAPAQPANQPWLFLSTAARNPDPATGIWDKDRHQVLLRPNVEETLYLYVNNPTGRNFGQLTVVLASGPEDADEFARATVPVAANQIVRVLPPKPAPPPVPAPAGAKPAPPPSTPLTKEKKLYLSLLGPNNQVLDRVPLPVRARTPSEYVAPTATFVGEPGSARNRLEVTLRDRLRDGRPFTGPAAKVHLNVSPALAPDLVPESVHAGTFQGVLPPGGSARLVASNLSFLGTEPRGVFGVSVDGYDNAFLFRFQTSGGLTTPQLEGEPLLRFGGLNPIYAIPGKPCLIPLEVDNPPSEDVVVEFAINRTNTDDEKDFVPSPHVGDRNRSVAARWDGAAGGLVFTTSVHYWVEDLDTAGMTGSRRLRLQLLDKTGKQVLKGDKPIPPVYGTIVLDDTPPEDVRLGALDKAVRNRAMDVAAVGFDPESGIKRVLFFLGDPPAADGKPAPNSRVVVGVPPVKDGAPYTGKLLMPDRTGRVQVGVRFINNVGLPTDVTGEVEVVDPPPKPTTGAVKVTVVQGVPPRPQPGMAVELRDAANKVILNSGDADEKGEYTFKDVAPGKYNVYSSRPRDFSKALKPVTVEAGATKEVTLELKR